MAHAQKDEPQAAESLYAAAESSTETSEKPDPRSTELVDLDCRSEIGRRATTLFANGTIRLREGPPRKEVVRLAELGPSDLEAYLRRLAAEDLSETDPVSSGPEGPWIERCSLRLALPDTKARTFRFDRYASISLALSRVLAVARELGDRVDELDHRQHHLPEGYEPALGDVLERADGYRFTVVGHTSDKKAVELECVEQPITIYVPVADVTHEFVAIISQRSP